jgi:very-short-patch-repair endonuclease
MKPSSSRFTASNAKRLRSEMTDAEGLLWFCLRNRQLSGFKFVRQHPVGRYIADFACREANLIVEIDGGQHAESATDAARTQELASHGYEVVRFWNSEVLQNLDGVLQALADRLSKAPSPGLRYAKSDLSPKGEVKERTR